MGSEADKLGWRLNQAPEQVAAVAEWLDRGRHLTGAVAIVAECQTDVLEFVYVERRDDRLVVSDRGDTAKYFERGDELHRSLGSTAIREICETSGALLVDVEDRWPHITVDSSAVSGVTDAVRIVAHAMDGVADAASIRLE